MLYLSREQVDDMIAHAREGHPFEVCGLCAGNNKKIDTIYRMTNTDKSEKTYFMDPQEQFAIMKEMRSHKVSLQAIYHSHPHSEAYPSAHDVELALYPEASYVIISLKDRDHPRIRSFSIVDGSITEEEIQIG